MPVDYLNDPLTITGGSPQTSSTPQPTLSDEAAAKMAKANMQNNMQQSQSHINDVRSLLNQPELDANHQFIQGIAQTHQNIVKAGPSLEEANKNYYNALNTHMQAVSKLNEAMQKSHPGQAASAFALSFLGLGSPYVQLMRMKNLGPAAMQEKSTKQAMDSYANLVGSLNKEELTALEDTMKSSDDTYKTITAKREIEGQIGTAINQASEIASRVMGIPRQNQEQATSQANEVLARQKAKESQFMIDNNKPAMDIQREREQIRGDIARTNNDLNAEQSKQQGQNRSQHFQWLGNRSKEAKADWKDALKEQKAAEKEAKDEEALAKDDPKGGYDIEGKRKAAKDAATAANRAHAASIEADKAYNDFAQPLVGHSGAQGQQSNPQSEMDQINAKFKASTDDNEKAQLSQRYKELYAVVHKGQ